MANDEPIDKALDERLQLRARVTELEKQLVEQPRTIADWLEQNAEHLSPPLSIAIEHAAAEIRELAWQTKLPAIYPCGCSKHKVRLGMCDLYKPGEAP